MNNKQFDIGTIILSTILEDNKPIDISSATLCELKIQKPSLITISKEPDFYTDGKDGKLKYVVIKDDFDEVGIYQIQGYVEMPSGKWNSSIVSFTVDSILVADEIITPPIVP